MSKIILKNINKSFGKTTVLKDINLEIKQGQLVSLLGPSGVGKTTILKIIAGLLEPDSGEIFVSGEKINNRPIEKRGTVIVFQEYLLFPHLNVYDNIGFGLKMAKRPKDKIHKQVEKMLKLVQLQGYEKRYPNELSGGQRQRVALARALAIEPKVLLLDEPFSNLDTKLKESIRELTFNIQKELKITTILVTHEIEESLMHADKIAVLLKESIAQFDTPEAIYQTPNSIAVAEFIGDNNYVQGKIMDNRFISEIFTVKTPIKDKDRATAVIKPESIEIVEDGEIEGKIISRKYAGDRIHYEIMANGIKLKAVDYGYSQYKMEDRINFKIHGNDILIFDEREGT